MRWKLNSRENVVKKYEQQLSTWGIPAFYAAIAIVAGFDDPTA